MVCLAPLASAEGSGCSSLRLAKQPHEPIVVHIHPRADQSQAGLFAEWHDVTSIPRSGVHPSVSDPVGPKSNLHEEQDALCGRLSAHVVAVVDAVRLFGMRGRDQHARVPQSAEGCAGGSRGTGVGRGSTGHVWTITTTRSRALRDDVGTRSANSPGSWGSWTSSAGASPGHRQRAQFPPSALSCAARGGRRCLHRCRSK